MNSRAMATIVISSNSSVSPKFYAYVICISADRLHKICKIKGITLNYKNLNINFDSIERLKIKNKRERRRKKERNITI